MWTRNKENLHWVIQKAGSFDPAFFVSIARKKKSGMLSARRLVLLLILLNRYQF